MSLVNWEEHRARFIALREEKGITVKEYCEEHGLREGANKSLI